MSKRSNRFAASIITGLVIVAMMASTALAAPATGANGWPVFPLLPPWMNPGVPGAGNPGNPWFPVPGYPGDPGTNPGDPGTGNPWFPAPNPNPGYPGNPGNPAPSPNPGYPGNPGNGGQVADGFPQGFVVPTSNETGRQVGGWGGDPTGRTDGGTITHVPVLFIHGSTRDAHDFDQVRQYFLDHGYTQNELWAVSYGFGSMQQPDSNADSVPTIQAFVQNMLTYLQTKNPGVTQIDIVTHSMGGTVVRAWLKQSGDYAAVHSLVEIAGPNHGLDGVPASTKGGQELQPGSQWLNDLNAGGETPGSIRYMTIYDGTGRYDQFYQGSLKDSPGLAGAENHAYNVEHGTSYDHAGLINGTVALQYQWVQGDYLGSAGGQN